MENDLIADCWHSLYYCWVFALQYKHLGGTFVVIWLYINETEVNWIFFTSWVLLQVIKKIQSRDLCGTIFIPPLVWVVVGELWGYVVRKSHTFPMQVTSRFANKKTALLPFEIPVSTLCPQKAMIEVPWGKTIVSLHVLTHRRASENPKGPLWDRFTHSYCGPARGHFWDSLDFQIVHILNVLDLLNNGLKEF